MKKILAMGTFACACCALGGMTAKTSWTTGAKMSPPAMMAVNFCCIVKTSDVSVTTSMNAIGK